LAEGVSLELGHMLMCRRTLVSENLQRAGVTGHTRSRTVSDLLRSRRPFPDRNTRPHGAPIAPTIRLGLSALRSRVTRRPHRGGSGRFDPNGVPANHASRTEGQAPWHASDFRTAWATRRITLHADSLRDRLGMWKPD
jgi:hypothetical protein